MTLCHNDELNEHFTLTQATARAGLGSQVTTGDPAGPAMATSLSASPRNPWSEPLDNDFNAG